jgi:hypothetical protein
MRVTFAPQDYVKRDESHERERRQNPPPPRLIFSAVETAAERNLSGATSTNHRFDHVSVAIAS